MKRKWSLLTLCLTLLMGLSLCLFAACGDGEKNVITATLSKTQVEVGETVTVTYSATEGEVSVTYKKDGGEAVTFTGTTFTPSAAGTYVFTFTAEGAEDVSKTLNVTEKAVTPATPVITASADQSEIFVGESVTFTYSATENAAVTVTYTKNGAAASGLTVTSGTPVTISEAGAYVFTFAAEGAESKTVSVTVKTRPVISLTVDDIPMTSGTTVPVCVGTTVDYVASVTEGAVLSASYKIGDAEPVALTSLSDEFTFETVGTYVFTLTADGAADFTLTVTVAAHTYGNTLSYTEAEYEAAGSTATIGCSNQYGCGTSITVTLPALTASDTWTESDVDPATCTAAGSKTMTCTVTASDDTTEVTITVTGVEIPKIDHTLVKTEAKTVTCTEAGWNEYWTCSVCDEIFAANSQDAGTGKTDVAQVESIYIPAAHTYGAGVWNNTEGKVEFTCSKNDSTVSADIVSLTLEGTSVEVTVDVSGKIESIEGTLTVTGGYNAVANTNINAGSIAIPYDDAGLTWTASKADQTLTVALGNVTSKALRVTVTESVKPVISLTVNEESMTNGDSVSVCVGTAVDYVASVTEDAVLSASYKIGDAEPVELKSLSDKFTFDTVGTYVFTLTADGADTFTLTVTVAAHTYGAGVWDTENQQVKFTCENCTDTKTAAITALTLQAGEDAYAVLNGDVVTLYNITLEGSFDAISEFGIYGGSVSIPVADEGLTFTAVAGESGSVTVKLGETLTNTLTVKVYTVAVEAGSVSVAGDRAVPVGTFTGEFEIRFTLSNLNRGNDAWNSWLLTFDSNGTTAFIREDNWVDTNFGRASGQFINEGGDQAQAPGASASLSGFMTTNVGFWDELNDFSNPQFVIRRTYADGVYTLTVIISEGNKVATLTLAEPETNGNRMTVSLGSNTATYDYSDILKIEKGGLTVSGISADAITVPKDTSKEAVLSAISVKISYTENEIIDIVSGNDCVCTSDGGYNGAVADTYTMTLEWGGNTATVEVTVEASAYSLLAEYTAEGGTIPNGGAITQVDTQYVDNAYKDQSLTNGFTFNIKFTTGESYTAWAPILGFKSSTNGYLSLIQSENNKIRLAFNAWDGSDNWFDLDIVDFAAKTSYDITVVCDADGTVTVYSETTQIGTISIGGLYARSPSIFISSTGAERMYFCGGAWWNAFDNWAPTGGSWNGLFSGTIQSVTLYTGINVPTGV